MSAYANVVFPSLFVDPSDPDLKDSDDLSV